MKNARLGKKGGEKAAKRYKKLVEFKNMFLGLYEALFGSDDEDDE